MWFLLIFFIINIYLKTLHGGILGMLTRKIKIIYLYYNKIDMLNK